MTKTTEKKLRELREEFREIFLSPEITADDAFDWVEYSVVKEAVEAEREKVIGKFYDFARERYQEPFDKHTASPSERWKRSGELRLVADLNRFCKELSQQKNE